jgi:hypothetical protein
MKKCILSICLLGFLALSLQAGPLKVYILAGQSNMVGHAKVETIPYIGEDPETAPMLKDMLGPDGQPVTCDDIWISYYTGHKGVFSESFGNLTAGYGARTKPEESDGKIGPEYTFGIYMQKHVKGPILIIKTAWGGKSLHTDFRPPSAGPYQLPEHTKQLWESKPNGAHGVPAEKDRPEWWAKKKEVTGVYYREMIKHVNYVLGDIKRVYPDYDAKQGYELAGFVWFQGWNDYADRTTYPLRNQEGGYDLYSELMSHFIRDVRKDLKAPEMPFVIGVLGVGGVVEKTKPFRSAMAKPASLPEFKDNVRAVETGLYWDHALGAIEEKQSEVRRMARLLKSKHKDHANKDGSMSIQEQKAYLEKYKADLISEEEKAKLKRGASNAGYHYLGSAKTFAQIGRAFADAVIDLEK